MNNEKILMDEEGYKDYLEKINNLETKLNELRLYKGTDAIYQGDTWHDNPTLYDAESKERSLMIQLDKLKAKENNIVIIKKKNNGDKIGIGSLVTVDLIFSKDDVEELTFKIIGGESKSDREISINSPLGRALYNNSVGTKTSYDVNNIVNVIIKKVI